MGERQFGSILTNFLQFWTHTTRPNVTKLFREVVLWLGGGTTCFWNERGVDAEFQSWEEGFWEPTGGRGGLVGKRGGEVSVWNPGAEGRPTCPHHSKNHVSSKKHTHCHFQYLVGLPTSLW